MDRGLSPKNLELLENLEPPAPPELLEEEPPLLPRASDTPSPSPSRETPLPHQAPLPVLLAPPELLGSPHKKHGPHSCEPCF